MRKIFVIACTFAAASVAAASCTTGPQYVYEHCFDVTDCEAAADGCYEITFSGTGATESMCSNTCIDDLDCLDNGACLNLTGSGGAICYQRCIDDFDCHAFFGCFDAVDEFGNPIDRICLPD